MNEHVSIEEKARRYDEICQWFWWLDRRKPMWEKDRGIFLKYAQIFFDDVRKLIEPMKEKE